MNVLTAEVAENSGSLELKLGDGSSIALTAERQQVLKDKGYTGKKIHLGIRPENLHDAEVDALPGEYSVMKSKVEVAELMGAETYLYLTLAGPRRHFCRGVPADRA
jgi:multiple sugar transport system ATP-binding protein